MANYYKLMSCSSSEFIGREKEYLLDCLNNNWLSQGKYVKRFEELFASIHNVKYAISCSSGTAALHLALLSLDVDENCAVIVPAMTYIATANAARYCNAKVIFADIDKDSWCISNNSIINSLPFNHRVEKINFIIAVSLFDSTPDMDCETFVPDIIHDSCQDVGQRSNAKISCYSFYGSKIIACGEGGMLTTNNDELAEKIKLFRGQGATTIGRYHHKVIGYNYRMTDMQAAVGLAQLERIDEILEKRRKVIDRYRKNLSNRGEFITLQGGQRASGWMMAITVNKNVVDRISRDKIMEKLLSFNIETRPFFEPLPSLPMYKEDNADNKYPVTFDVANRGICLPTHTRLLDDDIDYVCEKLISIVGDN